MLLTVRYFASIREAIGSGQEQVNSSASDLAALRDELIARGVHMPKRWRVARPCAWP